MLNNAGVVCWALTYLVLFAILIAGSGEKTPGAVRVASVQSFLMTLLCAVLALFPVINVPNPWLFSARMAAIVIVIYVIGAIHYLRSRKRQGLAIINSWDWKCPSRATEEEGSDCFQEYTERPSTLQVYKDDFENEWDSVSA